MVQALLVLSIVRKTRRKQWHFKVTCNKYRSVLLRAPVSVRHWVEKFFLRHLVRLEGTICQLMIVIPILRYHAVTSTVPLSSLPWLVGTCLFWHCDLINRLSKLISGTLCLVSFDLVIHQRKTHSWLILPLRAAPVFRANKILYEQSIFFREKNVPISKWFNNTYLSTWALF